MEEQGLWRLFFQTGLPEAYLAITHRRQAHDRLWDVAMPAFSVQDNGVKEN